MKKFYLLLLAMVAMMPLGMSAQAGFTFGQVRAGGVNTTLTKTGDLIFEAKNVTIGENDPVTIFLGYSPTSGDSFFIDQNVPAEGGSFRAVFTDNAEFEYFFAPGTWDITVSDPTGAFWEGFPITFTPAGAVEPEQPEVPEVIPTECTLTVAYWEKTVMTSDAAGVFSASAVAGPDYEAAPGNMFVTDAGNYVTTEPVSAKGGEYSIKLYTENSTDGFKMDKGSYNVTVNFNTMKATFTPEAASAQEVILWANGKVDQQLAQSADNPNVYEVKAFEIPAASSMYNYARCYFTIDGSYYIVSGTSNYNYIKETCTMPYQSDFTNFYIMAANWDIALNTETKEVTFTLNAPEEPEPLPADCRVRISGYEPIAMAAVEGEESAFTANVSLTEGAWTSFLAGENDKNYTVLNAPNPLDQPGEYELEQDNMGSFMLAAGDWTITVNFVTNRVTFMTGVSSLDTIEAAEAAEAEYFTLQGVRVAQPKAGNIYIRRAGTHAAKVIL